MPTCRICGETMPGGARTCTLCGSVLPDIPPAGAAKAPRAPSRPTPVRAPESVAPGGRFCPGCAIVYDPEYTDAFCICGTELVGAAPAVGSPANPPAASPPPASPPPASPPPATPPAASPPPATPRAASPAAAKEAQPQAPKRGPVEKPAAGTQCLVLVGADREVLHYFPLTKDATLIGRLDAVGGNFPDIDLDDWLDAATARKISRQHALILRSRVSGALMLRPLAGNTGTQLESEMVLPMQDYPLTAGQRLILGGAARFRFEIT
jgi:hypothetical protein